MRSLFTLILSRFNANSNDNYLLNRLNILEERIRYLEKENIETTNALYEIENRLEARIDILTLEKWTDKNV